MRKVQIQTGEYYHIYNRGVDKRNIFQDREDLQRFWLSMQEFNRVEPIGSIYASQFRKRKAKKLRDSVPQSPPLVAFIAYCINPNHFHFILEQKAEGGISKFMHRIGSGYTSYFNERYERQGSLLQGPFKLTHVDSDSYLLHLSVYVTFNNIVHGINSSLTISSAEEYLRGKQGICEKEVILNQFSDKRTYKEFSERSLQEIKQRKQLLEELKQEEV